MVIQNFCNMLLAPEAARPVVDQSGLSGKYDFQLHWSRLRHSPDSNTPVPSSDAPDIFTAIQEQLGLQLVPRKVPVKFVVIDHIEPPTEN